MQAWLDSVAPGYGPALMWTIAALVALLVLLIVIRIVRGITFGTFVAGGRNRKTRLAVMDATAVDSQRRLVLVRRDDVEHLILIGGPSDVVVEQNIRLLPPARRPGAEDPAPYPSQQDAPQPLPVPVPAPAPQRRPPPAAAASYTRQTPPLVTPAATKPVTSPPVSPAAPSPPPVSPKPTPPATPVLSREPAAAQTAAVQTLRPVTVAQSAPQQQTKPDLDESLLEELEVTLEKEHKPATPRVEINEVDRSLDDEMSRLLSDLSGPKR